MAKHILSCSFGKDSIATALLALQHGEPLDELVYCEVMFSEEISGELPEHNRFIHETAIPYFEQRGIPTRVLRSEKTYLSCFYHVVTRGKTKGMLSGFPLSGRCTIQRDCKLPPIKAYQKALPPDTVQYIGIAADEPKRLARLKPGQISLLDKYHVAEPEARSMYMILNCQVSENEMVENPLMMLFGELERRDPQHPAVLQFKSFMLGAKKTLQSILISAAANLYMFNSRKFAEMTSRDEMFLPRMGLEQRALFIVLPDNDTTFNFIATMLYTQLFDQLFRLADSTPEYNGALPVHVRLMMDEFANVALPKNFKNILAVCRSRNISCDIILQNIAQLKSLFKDDWEGIIGNCDTLLYLGGNEYGTYEYLSKILGKETERTKSQSIGKGSRGSSSDSLQTAGRELCMPDEIRRMRDDECLLLMRSEDPVIDKKYNLLHHPNVKYTPDAGGEPYVMPPDYMGDAVTITMGAVAAATAPEITEEMYEQLDYLEKHPEENYYENEENFSQYDQGD